jgi:hypothetical protein
MTDSYILRTDVNRPSYSTGRSWTSTPAHPVAPLNYDDAHVNHTPANHRRFNAAGPAQPPPVWDDHFNSLMHRTVRAYDLVMNYDRDSNGGTRWSRENIEHIRDIGAYLHGDVRALQHRQEVIAKEGEQDGFTMNRVRADIQNMQKYCEQIQHVIKNTERVPLRQRITRGDDHETNKPGFDSKKISLRDVILKTDSLAASRPQQAQRKRGHGDVYRPGGEDRSD